jgi:hypothetical protein
MKKLIVKISGPNQKDKIDLGREFAEFLSRKNYDMAVIDSHQDFELAADAHDVLVVIE